MARILCIEDEAALLRDLADELREAGYDVVEAANGEQGLRAISETNPDLVLCDITMPGMSGFDVLNAVRSGCQTRTTEIPFIFLTALADRQNIIDGKLRGADDYLTKPIDYDVVIATIQARLNQIKRLRTQNESDFAEKYASLMATVQHGAKEHFRNAINVFDHITIGVMIVSRDRRILQANTYATRMIEPRDGILVEKEVLVGPRSLRDMLNTALTAADAGDSHLPAVLDLPRSCAGSSLVASVFVWKSVDEVGSPAPMAAILVVDPDDRSAPPHELLSKLYGLTPAEAKVAIALMNGDDLKDVAASHGVAEGTARSQLKSIFSKTDTHRQGELIALLNRICIGSQSSK